MSSFNETIPIKSIQGGTGSVGTTAAGLVGAIDRESKKGVRVKNTHATQKLYVLDSRVSATLGYELGVNEDLFLELVQPKDIRVVGDGASTTYTWIAY